MYHVILAAALATSGGMPNHCYARQCSHGCYGGYSGYSGYSGYGHGCHGCHACHGPVGYGCAGGCYGYHGGCYGGFGVFSGEAHHMGAYGLGCTGCYGCYGGYAGYGVPLPFVPDAKQPVRADPFPPVNPDAKKKLDGEEVPLPKEKDKKPVPKKNIDEEEVRATITIEVPEGGKLFVDGKHVNVSAGTRTFQTPALTRGETYFYDIRVEVTRQDATASEQRRVFVRSGQEVAVQFPRLGPPGTLTASR